MVMHSRTSGQRGFMTAESLTSLFFYIIMVAALAGVASMLLTKTAGAKGAAAVAIARANVSGLGNLADYNAAAAVPVDQATHKIADAAGVIPGVGTMRFLGKPAAAPGVTEVGIIVGGIGSPDVCRAMGSVGFGSWVRVNAANSAATFTVAYNVSAAATRSAGGALTSGAATTKTVLETICGKVTEAAPVALMFVTR